MSKKTVKWAKTQKVYPAASVLLRTLAEKANHLGLCGVHDIRLLAASCGIPERTAYRALEFLKSTGRLFVQRRSSEKGLQIQSSFELNLERPADEEYECANRCSATKAERPCSGSANLTGLASDGSAKMPSRVSDGTARVAVPAPGGSASATERVSDGHATLTQRSSSSTYKKAVDLIPEEQQLKRPLPADPMLARDANLVTQLHDQMCLSYSQVADLGAEYSEEHLRLARDYVKDRHQKGKIQDGKLAAYFLAVVRKATPESLRAKPSTLDLPTPVPARSEREIAAEAAKAAKHEASRLELLKIHDAWNALDPRKQETIRDRFMTQLAEGNPIVYGSLRRSGKLADEIGHRMLMDWFIDDAQLGNGMTAITAGRGDE